MIRGGFVRLTLVASAIALWSGLLAGPAVAQSVSCTGDQTNTDAFGNNCFSLAVTGPQGPSNASATASGPLGHNGTANSQANNNSSATSNANFSASAAAVAFNSSKANAISMGAVAGGASATANANHSSTANAVATSGGEAAATADLSGTANAEAMSFGNSNAFAINSGTANAEASENSGAFVFASGPGTAAATASNGGSALATLGTSTTTSNGNAFAFESNGSGAQATVTTPNGFACAFATNGSFAQANDTAAPVCQGPDAVVVSTAGNCGAADNSPCAFELHNYFSNANTTGGQASVNITAPLEGLGMAPTRALQEGETCAMIYVFDTAQNMQACCGYPITSDGLLTLSINGNLALTPVGSTSILADGSIRIMSTFPNATLPTFGASLQPGENCDASTGVCCDPTAGTTSNTLIPGSKLVAWAQHVQNTQITESEFQTLAPTGVELNDGLPEACADILQLGTGAGQCSCSSGSLGVTRMIEAAGRQ